MAERISCFVMSGGVGSRLWPLSREDNPKQFHDLAGHGSMLVGTVRRLKARPAGEAPIHLIASERHAERVRADMTGIDLAGGRTIFEPAARNTAAAVAALAEKVNLTSKELSSDESELTLAELHAAPSKCFRTARAASAPLTVALTAPRWFGAGK